MTRKQPKPAVPHRKPAARNGAASPAKHVPAPTRRIAAAKPAESHKTASATTNNHKKPATVAANARGAATAHAAVPAHAGARGPAARAAVGARGAVAARGASAPPATETRRLAGTVPEDRQSQLKLLIARGKEHRAVAYPLCKLNTYWGNSRKTDTSAGRDGPGSSVGRTRRHPVCCHAQTA